VKIIIPIIPRGQRRARHAVRGKFSQTYKDPKQRHEEEALMALLAEYQPQEPFAGALMFGFKAYLPIPKSKSKKWKVAAAAGEIRPVVKPDLDNLAKHVKDCLTTMRFWEDDNQVVEYLPGSGKYYSDHPRWEIEIRKASIQISVS
jgi:Holliday junction resolvase RusA-like endonuclease